MMNSNLLISCSELQNLFNSGRNFHLFDCRSDLKNPHWGFDEFKKNHIPKATYVNLDTQLSGPKDPLRGRHPLPSPAEWAKTRGNLGIAIEDLIIIYDQAENLFSSRMWWMLVSTGYQHVALLDGGFKSWRAFNGNMESGNSTQASHQINLPEIPYKNLVLMDELRNHLNETGYLVLDARAKERFRGDIEPLDPIAGHIPGALNRPYSLNLSGDGVFKPAKALKQEFSQSNYIAEHIVHSCGSGVSACHNLFAMELAQLSGSKLYAGSWSEWCHHPNPIATGD
jgi:thiosulfate/3-mercaptopyruvate sulfurtransferase